MAQATFSTACRPQAPQGSAAAVICGGATAHQERSFSYRSHWFSYTRVKAVFLPAVRYVKPVVFLHRIDLISLGSVHSERFYKRATSNRNLAVIQSGQARFLFMRINITIGGERLADTRLLCCNTCVHVRYFTSPIAGRAFVRICVSKNNQRRTFGRSLPI